MLSKKKAVFLTLKQTFKNNLSQKKFQSSLKKKKKKERESVYKDEWEDTCF